MKTTLRWLILCLALFPAPSFAAEYLQAPWTLSYGDGSGNHYRFERTAPKEAVSFSYDPVRPEQSSTGMYSGGEPRRGRLTEKQAKGLLKRVAKLESDAALRVEERGKGTGAFTLKTPEGTRSFIIQFGPAIRKFDQFLKKLGS